MMIKNAVVLFDQVNNFLAQDQNRYGAIVTAAISRARPVGLAAGTTPNSALFHCCRTYSGLDWRLR